jgi:hypothetical protein
VSWQFCVLCNADHSGVSIYGVVLFRLGSWVWIPLKALMFVFVFLLWCPVEVEALRLADPPSRESYRMSNWFMISKVILSSNMLQGLIRKVDDGDDTMINEQWIGKDVERIGRGRTEGTIPEFAWRDWGNPWRTAVTILGVRSEIKMWIISPHSLVQNQ